MHRIRLLCAALLLIAGAAHAGIDNAGTTSANFLSVGAGASVLSMGGAALGTGGSLTASAWNPAALGLLAGPQYTVSHSALAMQSSQDWLSAGGRLRNGTTRWAVNAIYENDGDFEGRDQFGASTGTFNASNLALGASAARPFGQTMVLGAGFKWVNEYLGEVTGSGLAFDLGAQARAGPFGVGAAARNIGGKMKFESGEFAMPAVFGVGASWADPLRGLRFNLDANFPSAYYNDVRLGGEWMWQSRVAVRAGYRMELGAPAGEPLAGPSFGVGGGSNSMWVDYGFLGGAAEAQGAHRLSFSLHPGFMNPGGLAVAPTPLQSPEPALADRLPVAKPVPAPVVALSAPVAIVREPAKPVVAPPVIAIVSPVAPPVSASVPAVAPPVVASVRIEAPQNAMAAQAAPRATTPRGAALRTDKPARVPALVFPKPEPVAVSKPVALPVAAPVAVSKPVAPTVVPPVTPVAVAARAPVQLASSAPVAPVVVPSSAPSTEPIARPAPPVVAAAPAAPVARPSTVIVQANQTMADIAKQWGNSVPAIMMENNLVSDQVKAGMKLRLPPAGRK